MTDGRTDRRTDILPGHSPRYAYASRGKKLSNNNNNNKSDKTETKSSK